MKYSNIHESVDKIEFYLNMLILFGYNGIFTILLGIGFVWGSKVYWYEELMSEGVRSTDWSIDWDSASKGRAGRAAYAYDYYNIIVKYKIKGGKEYQDYATMSVANYQLLSQG